MIKKLLLLVLVLAAAASCGRTYAGTLTAESIRAELTRAKAFPLLEDDAYDTIPKETLKVYLEASSLRGRGLRYRKYVWDCDDYASLTASVARLAYAERNPTAKRGLAVFVVIMQMKAGATHAAVLAFPESGEGFFFEPQNGSEIPPEEIDHIILIRH